MTEPNGHVIHHDGYGKGLELTLSICLCYTLCVLGLRMYIRWRAFGTDDLVVSLSTVSLKCNSCSPNRRPDTDLYSGSGLHLLRLQLRFQQRRARPSHATAQFRSDHGTKIDLAVSSQQHILDHSPMLIEACHCFVATAYNSHSVSPATSVLCGSIDLSAMDHHCHLDDCWLHVIRRSPVGFYVKYEDMLTSNTSVARHHGSRCCDRACDP